VAALEAKNEEAAHQNENLRDLLTQLQNENLILKQTSFTFSVPKNAASSVDPARETYSTDFGSAHSPIASPPKLTNPLDWSSLTAFDPSMLNLLDDGLPQPTATEGAMQMDFGFGSNSTGLSSNSPYTTIASNPSFMTFASAFDTMSPPSVDTNPTASTSNSGNNAYNFDMNNLSTWANSPQSNSNQEFDDLLSGYLGNTNNNVDFSFMNTPSSLSPISHHLNKHSPAASSSSSSPSFSGSDPLFSSPRESLTSDSDAGHDESECPKTRSDLLRKIVETGPSPFGPPMPLRKRTDSVLGSMITCAGSNFPKTVKSDQNIEVLSAWRSITSNPNFKVCLSLSRREANVHIWMCRTRISIHCVKNSLPRHDVTGQRLYWSHRACIPYSSLSPRSSSGSRSQTLLPAHSLEPQIKLIRSCWAGWLSDIVKS